MLFTVCNSLLEAVPLSPQMLITSEAAVPQVFPQADTANGLRSMRTVACLMNPRHVDRLSTVSESHVQTGVF